MKHLFLLSVVLAFASGDSAGEQCEVTAPIGRIRGSIMTSRLGKRIYSFRGVRYAEPPTGQLRFQVAVPAADWNDVFDATKEGPACPAIHVENIMEDCLRVNVYTTKLPSASDPVKRPVLVFFHPGAFYIFSGQSSYFGPEYLLDKDIVLVTVNNRLATLGFLSTGDSKAPGNLGLKDQVVALRWVQRNIVAFGGNPDSVTISGYSIGGFSVLLHMVSPMSKGLFHRAIMMSGSMTSEPYPTEQLHLAKKQAELLNCPSDTTDAMLVCLSSKPVENFTDTIPKFFLAVENQRKLGNNSILDDLNNDWYKVAPIAFLYERDTPRSRYISTELRQFYFGNQSIGPDTYDNLAHIKADSLITFPLHRAVKLLAENTDQSIYFYVSSYQGRYSFVMWNKTTPYGVVHHDDLQYLFFMKNNFPFFENNAPEIPMVELMTIPSTLANNVTWDPYLLETDNYLEISEIPKMKTGLYPERMQKWESLFPLNSK
ncbi:hypothetical protein ACFW04_001210 [Cataglyphis niger]